MLSYAGCIGGGFIPEIMRNPKKGNYVIYDAFGRKYEGQLLPNHTMDVGSGWQTQDDTEMFVIKSATAQRVSNGNSPDYLSTAMCNTGLSLASYNIQTKIIFSRTQAVKETICILSDTDFISNQLRLVVERGDLLESEAGQRGTVKVYRPGDTTIDYPINLKNTTSLGIEIRVRPHPSIDSVTTFEVLLNGVVQHRDGDEEINSVITHQTPSNLGLDGTFWVGIMSQYTEYEGMQTLPGRWKYFAVEDVPYYV